MKIYKKLIGLGIFTLCSSALGVQLGSSWVNASSESVSSVVGQRAHLPAPEGILKMAQADLPYIPQIPIGIPAALTLDLADYGRPKERDGVPSWTFSTKT